MFDEPVFVLDCCTTAKFGKKKNTLFKYAKKIIYVGHI